MRNIVVLFLAVILLIFSFINEPISNTIDSIGGATNETYGPLSDSVAGASYEHEDDEHEDDEHEDDEHEDDEHEEEDD